MILGAIAKDGYKNEFQHECLRMIYLAASQSGEKFKLSEGSSLVVKLYEFMRSGDLQAAILSAKVILRIFTG